MNKSKVLEKLRKGEPVLCAASNFKDPAIVELIGLIGFDCIWICQEHLWRNKETIFNMITAARATGMDSMIRIDKTGYTSAIQPLEMGAKGIMVPHIKSAEEAKFWIESSRFSPIGRRGLDGANADADWSLMDLNTYLEFSNRETFLALQIEDPEVLPYLEDIAKLPGFDILFVGVGDLTYSLGFPGEFERDEVWKILKDVVNVAKKYGKIAGTPGVTMERTKKLLDLGYLFISAGADVLFLRNSFLKLRRDYESIGFTFGGIL